MIQKKKTCLVATIIFSFLVYHTATSHANLKLDNYKFVDYL